MKWQLVPTVGLGTTASQLFGVAEDPSGQVWAVGSKASSAGVARTLVIANCPACA